MNISLYLWLIPILPFAGFLINGSAGRRLPRSLVSIVALLFPLADRVILTAPANSRAMDPAKIPAPPGAVVTHSVAEALEIARKALPGDVVFVTGSLFVVGEARALLVQ